MSDMRAIDDAEALKVLSELSELDPRIRDDVRVLRERRAEADGVGGPSATPGGGAVAEVPME
eukprot:1739862-Amphidinium_carterae.1